MKSPIHILLIEDSTTDAKLVIRELERSVGPVEAVRLDEPEAVREALSTRDWDMVLSDWSMPRFSALAALELLRELALDVPLIIVSGTIGEETAVAALRAGATDFVVKDRLARLGPAVARELSSHRSRRERAATEAALRDSQALNRRLVDTNIVGVVYWGTDAPLAANDAFLSTFGYTRADLTAGAVSWERMTPPEHAAADERAFRELATTGRCRPYEKELLHKDGTRIPILTAAATDDARTDRGVAFVLDLRERDRARADLRASEARFSRLSESGIIGIVFADTLGNIHDCNDAYLRIMGCTRTDLTAGRLRWADRTPPEWHEVDARATHSLATTGVSAPWEKEMIRGDGSRVPVLVGVAMLEPPRCIAFAVDLTERKRAEEALRRSEEQLRQSQKLEAIGVLAGGVAHDFNNLMSVILSYSSWIKDELKSGGQMLDDVVEIQRAAERATDLTRQLLAFSRRQRLQPDVVRLDEIVSGMEKMLRRLIGEDIELSFVAEEGIQKVLVDPGQIEQVVMNLVVNARDAMPTGGKLAIGVANVELGEEFAAEHVGVKPGPHVRLSVSDTGCGMDAETQARIFEPFFTTKPVGKGTGLGLSTVLGIVQQSGGTTWVESAPGWGSSFKVYLPRVEGATMTAVPFRAGPVTGSETILVVEDDAPLRILARTILRRSGYHVLDAPSGGDALLICEKHPEAIHLLLTDVVMPRMSGSQLSEQLRPSRPEMRVLYMSGYVDDAIELHGVNGAEVALLHKPITPEILLHKVREVLDSPPERAPPA